MSSKTSIPQDNPPKQLELMPDETPVTPPGSPYSIQKFKQDGFEIQVGQTDEDVWLTRNQIAELLGISTRAVGQQIDNYKASPLKDDSVVKSCFITASDRKRYNVEHYSMKVVEYIRMRSHPSGYNGTSEVKDYQPIVVCLLENEGWDCVQSYRLPSGKIVDICAIRNDERMIIECKKSLKKMDFYRALGQVISYSVEIGHPVSLCLACPVGEVDEYAYSICKSLNISIIEF